MPLSGGAEDPIDDQDGNAGQRTHEFKRVDYRYFEGKSVDDDGEDVDANGRRVSGDSGEGGTHWIPNFDRPKSYLMKADGYEDTGRESPYKRYLDVCVKNDFTQVPLGYFEEDNMMAFLLGGGVGMNIISSIGDDGVERVEIKQENTKEHWRCIQTGSDSTTVWYRHDNDIESDNEDYFMNFEMYRRILSGMQGTKEKANNSNAGKLGNGELGLPIDGVTEASITSGFGWRNLGGSNFHDGIDFGLPTGTDIYASINGKVTAAYTGCTPGTGSLQNTCGGGAGNYVQYVSDDGKYEITVMHGQNVTVSVGDTIKAGDKLMELDHTGQSTAAHLHYRLHVNGVATDPTSYLFGTAGGG
jgi:hypothetical protein